MNTLDEGPSVGLVALAVTVLVIFIAGILDSEPAPTPSPATECECVCEPAPAPDLTTEPQMGTET